MGKIEGFFTIPEHSFEGQGNVPKFETQKELEFRLTSSSVNVKVGFNGVLIGGFQLIGQTTYYDKWCSRNNTRHYNCYEEC